MPIIQNPDPDPYVPGDQDYRLNFTIQVTSSDGPGTIPVQVFIQPGSQGNTEAQVDAAAQALVDHLDALPDLLPGSLASGKIIRTNYTITPTGSE
jgi:hypothetical protein